MQAGRNKLWNYCYVAIKWMPTKAIKDGTTPLHIACRRGQKQVVEVLLRSDKGMSTKAIRMDRHHFIKCAGRARNKLAILLRGDKVDVNKVNKDGDTHFIKRASRARNKLWKYFYVAIKWMSTKSMSWKHTTCHCKIEGHSEIVKMLEDGRKVTYTKSKLMC